MRPFFWFSDDSSVVASMTSPFYGYHHILPYSTRSEWNAFFWWLRWVIKIKKVQLLQCVTLCHKKWQIDVTRFCCRVSQKRGHQRFVEDSWLNKQVVAIFVINDITKKTGGLLWSYKYLKKGWCFKTSTHPARREFSIQRWALFIETEHREL